MLKEVQYLKRLQYTKSKKGKGQRPEQPEPIPVSLA